MTIKDIQKAIKEGQALKQSPLDVAAAKVLQVGIVSDMEAAQRYVMKHEAHARLQLMNVFPKAIFEFMERGVLNKSEAPLGALYWLDEDEKKIVSDYEQRTGNLVYHVTKAGSDRGDLGVMYSLYYVSRDFGEWLVDREDIAQGTPWTYTYCATYPRNSESGRISVEYRNGGVVRVA